MKKIRILFILPKLSVGGAEMQLRNLLGGINKRKFDIYLGTLYHDPSLEKEFQKLDSLKIAHFHKRGILDMAVYFRLARFIKENNIDIVQTFLGNHHSYLPTLISGRGISVGGVRGNDENISREVFHLKEILIPRLLMRRNRFTLISNSHCAKEGLVKKGLSKERILVIPNGIDSRLFSHGNGEKVRSELSIKGKTIISTISRLVPIKNHLALIESIGPFLGKRKDAILLIVGDGPEKESLIKKRDGLNLAKQIIFTGKRRDINNILAATDIFVFPSLFENWPNSVGEAMSMQKPVLAFPAGDTPKIIRDGVNGMIAKDFHEFMDKLNRLSNNPALRERLGKQARKTIISEFSIEKMVKQYEDTYVRLYNESHDSP